MLKATSDQEIYKSLEGHSLIWSCYFLSVCLVKRFHARLNLYFLLIARLLYPGAHVNLCCYVILLLTRSPFCRIEILRQLNSVPAKAKGSLNKPKIMHDCIWSIE